MNAGLRVKDEEVNASGTGSIPDAAWDQSLIPGRVMAVKLFLGGVTRGDQWYGDEPEA